jgi:hypothetical protein
MKMIKSVVAKCQVEGFHFWPTAPDEVEFLRNSHRHIFHVTLSIQVQDDNREIEFILLKRWLQTYLEGTIPRTHDKATGISCEQIAVLVIRTAQYKYGDKRIYTCIVSEDDENGAMVTEEFE